MTTFPIGVALLLVVALLVAVVKATLRGSRTESFGARWPLTRHEQAMYWRLADAFPHPEHVVLAQVSFSALLVAKRGTSRYRFAQKRADFVLVDKSFKVRAVIELDDKSHTGKGANDRDRDSMLEAAGYRVFRYPAIPDTAKLRADILPAETPAAGADPQPSR